MATLPSEALRTGIDARRTEFSFGDDSTLDAQRWLAQEIAIEGKLYANIKAINYSDEYYSGDGVNLSAYTSGYDEGYD